MNYIDITNRELASIIILVVAIGYLSIKNKSVRSSLGEVTKAFLQWRILLLTFLYLVYALTLLVWAYKLNIWSFCLLKDSVIITLSMYVFIISKATSIKSEKTFFKEYFISIIGITALLTFYINTVSFSLIVELVLQIVVTFLVLLNYVASINIEHKSIVIFSDVILVIIGLFLIYKTTEIIIANTDIFMESVSLLVLSITLPITILPFIYIFSVYARYEGIYTRMKLQNEKLKFRVKLAVLIQLRLRTLYTAEFDGKWQLKIIECTKFIDALKRLSEFKKDVKSKLEREKIRLNNLKKYSGVLGVDDMGNRLDRREFYETKKILEDIYYVQMGQNRNRLNHYRDDLIKDNLSLVSTKNIKDTLMPEHGFNLIVSENKDRYYAWRKTIGGWYFGIGGTPKLDEKWQYDGSSPPMSFPTDNDLGWKNVSKNEPSIEWNMDDNPQDREE